MITDKRYSLAVIAVAAALVACAGVFVAADGSEASDASGTCGDDLTWTYTGKDHTLTISGSGEMYNWTWFGDEAPWHDYCKTIQKVVLPEGLTSIGDLAFDDLAHMTSVNIPSSVTFIGDGSFNNCSSLGSVIIPSSVTYIGLLAFRECTSLTSVTIPSSVTYIGESAFLGCGSLTAIDVDDGNTEYSSLDGILYDKAKTKLLQCPAGTEQTSLTIPSTVISIVDDAFEDCSTLESVVIPSSVISIGNCAFESCESLTSVTIPSSVTSIGWDAFYVCTSLISVAIPSSVTSIGEGAFNRCTSLTAIDVDAGNTMYSSSDGILYDKEKTELIQCPACTKLTSVAIPSSVTSIDWCAFDECSSLTSVAIPSSVKTIDEFAFSECTSLTSVDIPSSVTSIGHDAFWFCSSLRSVTLSSSLTSINEGVFAGCTSLTSVTIPSSVTSIGWGAFSNCTSLTSVSIPSSVRSIDSCAFYNCTSLAEFDVDPDNADYSSSDGFLFNKDGTKLIKCLGGTGRTSVTVPGTVTSIADYAFESCNSLGYVTIPSSVTSIADYAFRYFYVSTVYNESSLVFKAGDYGLSYSTVISCDSVVTFDDNGGVLSGKDTSAAVYGKAFDIPQTASRNGYVFMGWSTAAEGGDLIVSGDEWGLKGDITLYACWLVSDSTVVFDTNTSDGSGKLVGDRTADAACGQAFVFDQTAFRDGYMFVGWFTAADGGEQITSGIIWETKGDVTLYAHWSAREYTVTLYANGGSFDAASVTKYTVIYGQALTISATVTLEHYFFAGWFTAKTGGTEFVSGDNWTIAWNTSLYAHWGEKSGSTATFDPNTPDGSGRLIGDSTAGAVRGEVFSYGQTASRDGYRFIGWFTAADGGEQIISGNVWELEGDVTLYAHWEEEEESSGTSVWVIAVIAIAAIAAVGVAGYVIRSRRRPWKAGPSWGPSSGK